MLYALVVIFFTGHGHANVHVVDHLNAEDCIEAISQHSTEDEIGVWACTLDYDF